MVTYRGPGPWGAGKGSNLTAAEFDGNTYQLLTLVNAKAAQGVGIQSITIVGDQMWVALTDSSILGPYTLPVAPISFVGEWQPSTLYLANQILTAGGKTYIVMANHTSALTFDPGANDGHGNDYYGLLLDNPAAMLPVGGSVGMVLEKPSATAYSSAWVWSTLAGQHDVLQSPAPDTGDLVYWNGAAFTYIDPASLSTAAQSLRTLTDVLASPGPTTNQVVYWNGSKFTYASLSTLYPIPAQALAALSDVSASPIATTGQLVYFDGAKFNFEDPATGILTDVNITAPQNKDVLSYDTGASKWINVPSGLIYTVWNASSYVAALSDGNSLLDNLAGGVLTIPAHATVAFPTAFTLWVRQSAQYQIGITGSLGVTINPPPGKQALMARPGSLVAVQQTNVTDVWNLTGDLIDIATGVNALPTTGSFTIDTNLTSTDVFTITPTGNITMSIASGPPTGAPFGRRMLFIITTSGTSSFTFTFSANFKSTGTLATGVVSGKSFVIQFVSDGTFFYEVSRTTAM